MSVLLQDDEGAQRKGLGTHASDAAAVCSNERMQKVGSYKQVGPSCVGRESRSLSIAQPDQGEKSSYGTNLCVPPPVVELLGYPLAIRERSVAFRRSNQ
jgi:hypothetical protein